MSEAAPFNDSSPASAADEQIGRLLNEYLERQRQGERITREMLRAEHANLADVLEQHLRFVDVLACESDPIRELLSKRALSPPSSSDSAAELGHYKIKGVIGRGGMGIVLRAIEVPLSRPVALKILRPELAVDHRALVRFEHEARAAAALRHPNIVTVYACGALNGTHYLAMEAIDGPSLAERLTQAPALSTEETLRILRELLLGLAAAHHAGLVHRDIKPSNLLLDGSDQRVKIADFGLARIVASATRITQAQAAIGTPEYMSPEQARGDERIDHRTDLYSTGVVLFEMLTGDVPFKAESGSAVIQRIIHEEPPDPHTMAPGCDSGLSALAIRLLAKRPEERIGSATDVLLSLENPSLIPKARTRRTLRRTFAAISLLVLVTAVLIRLGTSGGRILPRFRASSTGPVEVEVEKNTAGQYTGTIKARFGNSLEWKRFHTFAGPDRQINTVLQLAKGLDGDPIVLAGVQPPINSRTLWALDASGEHELWGVNLSSPTPWPDCESVNEFIVTTLLAVPNDDPQIPTVLFAASDMRWYPTYLGILDLQTREINARCWHLGQIATLVLAPNLLGEKRPALIALGVNNKLDGFAQRRDGDERPIASFDWVPIIMVIDLSSMRGDTLINVPSVNGRVPWLPSVLPRAYAFLDAATGPDIPRRNPVTGELERAEAGNHLTFGVPRLIKCTPNAALEQCMELPITRGRTGQGGGLCSLDADLVMKSFEPHATEREERNQHYWHERLRPLVQNSRRVSDAP